MQDRLFKKSSVERFSSPEKLNDFIQVANPSSWMILGAVLSLVLGVLAWGIFGEVTESMTFTGVVREGALHCYVDAGLSGALEEDAEVFLSPLTSGGEMNSVRGRIEEIAEIPISYAEASVTIESDFMLDALRISAWNTAVQISAEEALREDMVYSVSIVTDIMRPIDLVFR